MYNVKDNAESSLQVWLSSLATTLVVEMWTGMIFPAPPFVAVLNRRDSDWKITKSEKVEVIAKDWDQFTINRGFDWDTPQDFNAWDYFSLFVLAKHIQELQEAISSSSKSTSIANEYSSESTYSIGDIVMHGWERYKCRTAVSTPEEFNSNKWTKVNIQTDLNSMKTTLDYTYDELEDIKTNWVLTPHLAENLCIWELYTASDKLYLLHSPTNANSWSIAYAIWDVDARKSLHIQAIWSWVASNSITMKIRNIWSPTTTLVCEIQRWTRYNVSTTEQAWYGDWTTIATWTLSYSNFNHLWTTVTFTFDNSFWWTRWELLDIVIHQQDEIVNATNYYEIACDWTQYSEALRLISVNWTSRVYTKFMPFVESNAFEKIVVAKQKTTNYAASAVVEKMQEFSGSTSSWYGTVTCSPSSLAVNTTLLRWRIVYLQNRLQPTMTVWATTVFSRDSSITSWETSKAAADNVVFSWYKSSWWSSMFYLQLYFYYYLTENSNIPYNNNLPSVMLQWVYQPWTISKTILFGLVDKNTWRDWGYGDISS